MKITPYSQAFLGFALCFLFACGDAGGQGSESDKTTANTASIIHEVVQPDDFERLLTVKEDYLLIDVRTPMELKDGYLSGMTHHLDKFDDDFDEKLAKVITDKNKPIFVYCGIGGRSAEVCDKLKAMQCKEVYDLDGGIKNWLKKGKNIQKQS